MTTALPPAVAVPLWQVAEAQVLVAGAVGLLDANAGTANAVGTFNCTPKNKRTMRTPLNRRSIVGRNRFTVITPRVQILTGQRGVHWPQPAAAMTAGPLTPEVTRLHRLSPHCQC